MINEQKISGLLVLSEVSWGCFPFMESLQSFLPVVDEMVISFNVWGKEDGSLERIKTLNDSKIRIISTIFDIEKYGWASYAVARTMGYQACKGDVILMFDADGVLHEGEQGLLNQHLGIFINTHKATGYWEKHRIYKPTVYYPQHKHSGIYSKRLLGDRFDFFRDWGKGAPNFDKLTEEEKSSYKFPVTLFGYEHIWDTEEVLRTKVNRYGRMIDGYSNKPFLTPEEYFQNYMRELVDRVNREGLSMPIEKHPAVIQEKLRNVNETNFGYDFFGFK